MKMSKLVRDPYPFKIKKSIPWFLKSNFKTPHFETETLINTSNLSLMDPNWFTNPSRKSIFENMTLTPSHGGCLKRRRHNQLVAAADSGSIKWTSLRIEKQPSTHRHKCQYGSRWGTVVRAPACQSESERSWVQIAPGSQAVFILSFSVLTLLHKSGLPFIRSL